MRTVWSKRLMVRVKWWMTIEKEETDPCAYPMNIALIPQAGKLCMSTIPSNSSNNAGLFKHQVKINPQLTEPKHWREGNWSMVSTSRNNQKASWKVYGAPWLDVLQDLY